MSPSEQGTTMVDLLQQSYHSVRTNGYGAFKASTYLRLLGERAVEQIPQVLESFDKLPPDPHMGDGGTYRQRAYSRYSLEVKGWGPLAIAPLPGNSIYQSTDDNPVNGGVLRTFAPLAPEIAIGPFVHALIDHDAAHAFNCDPTLLNGAVVVGVHQVRIVACSQAPGLPTPEGVHRDAERWTFQHFMARVGVDGGEFRAYDDQKRLLFSWLQQDCLDTVMFASTTWHSATPIACTSAPSEGYRDIFLVDFDRV